MHKDFIDLIEKGLLSGRDKDDGVLVVCSEEDYRNVMLSFPEAYCYGRVNNSSWSDAEVCIITPEDGEDSVDFNKVASITCAFRYRAVVVDREVVRTINTVSYLVSRCIGNLHLLS